MKIKDGLIGHDYDIYYNSNGHRCKEINETNLRNYILFAGDNLSLALDKRIEETYPSIISRALRMDYYNISVFNGGFDCTKHNLLSWLYTKPKPKAIVIGFEFLNAIVKSEIAQETLDYVDYNDKTVQDVLDSGNYCGFFWGRKELFNILAEHIIDVPIYQISFTNRENLFNKLAVNVNCDNDVFDHQSISEKIINLLETKSKKIMP